MGTARAGREKTKSCKPGGVCPSGKSVGRLGPGDEKGFESASNQKYNNLDNHEGSTTTLEPQLVAVHVTANASLLQGNESRDVEGRRRRHSRHGYARNAKKGDGLKLEPHASAGSGVIELVESGKSNFLVSIICVLLLVLSITGYLMNRAKVQDRKHFKCQIMVHEVTYSENVQTRVRFKVGNNEVDSCLCTMGGSNRAAGSAVAIFEDVVSLRVPRNSQEVLIMLVNDKNKSILAECTVSTESILKEQRTMMFDMAMKNQGRSLISKVPCIFVSWKVDATDTGDASMTKPRLSMLESDSDAHFSDNPRSTIQARTPLLLQGFETDGMNEDLRMLLWNRATDRQHKLGAAKHEMSAKGVIRSQLEMLAEIAQGWLNCEVKLPAGSGNFHLLYKLYSDANRLDCSVKHSLGSWKLGWWTQEDNSNKAPKGSIPVLSISQIYGLANEKDTLVIVYLDTSQGKCQEQTLQLTCPDRGSIGGRDVWVEALQNFVKRLRALRHQEEVDFFCPGSRGKYTRKSLKDSHGAKSMGSSES